MWAGAFVRGIGLTSVVTAASCGGLVAVAPDERGDDGGTIDDAGARPPGADASRDGGKGKPPPTGPKTQPDVLRCDLSDGPFYIAGPGNAQRVDLVVRLEGAALRLYVSNGGVLRRYVLTSESPCVLDRDQSFAAPLGEVSVNGGAFAIDELGVVWLSSDSRVRRLVPIPMRRCTMDPAYEPEDGPYSPVGPLFLDEGGKTGWGLGGPPGKLGRLTLGTDACSVVLVDAPWNVPLRSNTPRDAQKRLHVVGAPVAGTIGIYSPELAFVKSYFGKKSANDPEASDVTRCAGGQCVLAAGPAGQSVVYVTEEGEPRATYPLIEGLHGVRIAADRVGPVFVVGPSDTKLEPEHQVVIQLAPIPPP